MVKFMDLPDVVLLLILEKLPIWKALQLGRLCHRLNHLKQVCFNTRITRLRLFVGSTVNKTVFYHEKADFFHLHGDYDLIIRFASLKTPSSLSIYSNITLSEDWLVKSADQIGRLGQLLPKITSLTMTLYGIHEFPNCCANLLANWPQLKSLKALNYCPNRDFMQHTLPAINSLSHLENLQLDLGLNIEHPEQAFAALFGKLKTFITPNIIKFEQNTEDGRIIFTSAWNGENAMIHAMERGLETFGLSKYRNHYNLPHLENRTLIRKLKYLQARLDFLDGTELAKWQLSTDWTALQCLHLDFYCKTVNSSFRPLLNHLTVLINLTELHLNLYTKDSSEYLSLEDSETLPRFTSVRRFQVKCFLEPHNLHLLSNVFPNARLSLLLWNSIITSNDDRDSYCAGRPELSALCGECKENMKRAIDRYGDNIASFHWFLEQGQNSVLNLIPKVKLFTTEISGRIRPNYDCIPY